MSGIGEKTRYENDMDDDDLLEQMEAEHWAIMRQQGHSEEDILKAKKRKLLSEDVNVYISCDYTDAHLRLAMALEGLNRRKEAIYALERGYSKTKSRNPKLALALAKLLFKDDQKAYSLALCRRLADTYKVHVHHHMNINQCAQKTAAGKDVCGLSDECHSDSESDNEDGGEDADSVPQVPQESDVAQAYYLAGWTYIHDDNHSEAYRTWSEGHAVVPSCPLLARQHHKRDCWDDGTPLQELLAAAGGMVGGGAYGGDLGSMDTTEAFDAFSLSAAPGAEDPPAVSLFDASSQSKQLVFRSRQPLLLPEECRRVVREVERHHADKLGGTWGTVRNSSVKTTDVAVEDIPVLRVWLLALLQSRVFPLIDALFPLLGDGTTIGTRGPGPGAEVSRGAGLCGTARSRMRVHDAFIVRYDAEKEKSLSLPEHCDTSAVSVVLALNSEEEGEYSGGGTWFEALADKGTVVNADVGKAVIFAGPLKHAGYPITRGVRNILVLFLYVEDFHYGPLIQEHVRGRAERPQEVLGSVLSPPAVGASDGPVLHQSTSTSTTDSGTGTGASITSTGIRTGSGSGTGTDVTTSAALTPGPRLLNSGGEERGFVVYRQTVELVNMLESSSLTVTD